MINFLRIAVLYTSLIKYSTVNVFLKLLNTILYLNVPVTPRAYKAFTSIPVLFYAKFPGKDSGLCLAKWSWYGRRVLAICMFLNHLSRHLSTKGCAEEWSYSVFWQTLDAALNGFSLFVKLVFSSHWGQRWLCSALETTFSTFSLLYMVDDLGFELHGVILVAILGVGHSFVTRGFIKKW